MEAVRDALKAQLDRVSIGDPAVEGVRMGALAGLDQRTEVESAVAKLMQEAELLYTVDAPVWVGADADKGAFTPRDCWPNPLRSRRNGSMKWSRSAQSRPSSHTHLWMMRFH